MALTDVATKVVELVPIAMAVGIAEKALEIPGKTAGAGKTNKSPAKKKQKKQSGYKTAKTAQTAKNTSKRTSKRTGNKTKELGIDKYDIMTIGLP